MASFKFYFLSALLCGVLILGQAAEGPTTEAAVTIDLKPTTETITTSEITTPTTPTTTEPIPTTTQPTTTSTTPSTTTSTTPSTTTSTTPATTTSTTPSTTTSTTPPPKPTPTPAPLPPKPIGPPEQGLWPYVSKNVTCVIVQFAAQLNVTYGKPNSSSSELVHVILNVPANATVVSGNCDGNEQWLTLSWNATDVSNHTLTVLFMKNDTTKSYQLERLNASLVASIFPNITNIDTINLTHNNTAEWQTPLATSYRCTTPTELKMNSDNSQLSIAGTLTLTKLQEEAFRSEAGKGFSAARDCSSGDIPDAVPIAVGCALGGMVVVVLIAYLVARRRSAARGYLSM